MSEPSTGFAARAAVAAECDLAGRTRIARLRSDGPLALRECGDPGRTAVYLVGAGAGPLGGDDLELVVDVGPGARLEIRSAAATVVLPGRRGAPPSRLVVRARVGAGGRLVFAPEPSVAASGCDHRAVADVELDKDAELVWQEEIVLGRHGERPGRYVGRLDVTVCGVPLLRHELRLDADAASAAVLGDAKAAGAVLLAGPGLEAAPYAEEGLAVMPLAGPGVLVTALADDAAALRRHLTAGRAAVTRATPPAPGRLHPTLAR